MADSPRKRYSGSPSYKRRSPSRSRSRTRSRSRGRSVSRSPSPRRRSRSRSASPNRVEAINPGNTLYVTGLSTRVTERDLEDHFAKKGKVANCLLVVEPRTRLSRGFAFVTMDSNDDAERCIKHLNQSVLLGRYITVEKLDEFPAIGFSCIASTKHSQNFPIKQPQHLLQLSTTNRRTLATLGGHLVSSTSCNLATVLLGTYLLQLSTTNQWSLATVLSGTYLLQLSTTNQRSLATVLSGTCATSYLTSNI